MDIIETVENFYNNYKGIKGVYGFSENKKPLYFLRVKKSDYPKIIVTSAIHGREYITSLLQIKQMEYFIKYGKCGDVYFLPMLNPDGVYISLYKIPLYKANYNGVDLNVNFDAKWGTGKSNVKIRGNENYIGEFPFSESETIYLRDFTYMVKPHLTISYHSKGEEIYYEFGQIDEKKKRDYDLAKIVAKRTGYKIKHTPCSAGGYKDWCIEKLGISALTIEVGNDKLTHPITLDKIDEIKRKNYDTINLLTEEMKRQKYGY